MRAAKSGSFCGLRAKAWAKGTWTVGGTVDLSGVVAAEHPTVNRTVVGSSPTRGDSGYNSIQFFPKLLPTVTGLTVADFHLLVKLKVINTRTDKPSGEQKRCQEPFNGEKGS